MTRRLVPTFAVVALAAVAAPAAAQPQVPGGGAQRPVFSPYLNLLNGGSSPALNYFGLVLPQQQFQQQAAQLQQQLSGANSDFLALQNQNRMLAGGLIDLFLPSTGHVGTFNNTGGYFNRVGGGSASFGGGRPGGASGVQPAFARPGGAIGSAPRTPTGGGVGVPGASGVRR